MPPTRLGLRLEQEFQSELIETLVGPWGCAGGEAQIPLLFDVQQTVLGSELCAIKKVEEFRSLEVNRAFLKFQRRKLQAASQQRDALNDHLRQTSQTYQNLLDELEKAASQFFFAQTPPLPIPDFAFTVGT
jgi:hypothetical protein